MHRPTNIIFIFATSPPASTKHSAEIIKMLPLCFLKNDAHQNHINNFRCNSSQLYKTKKKRDTKSPWHLSRYEEGTAHTLHIINVFQYIKV